MNERQRVSSRLVGDLLLATTRTEVEGEENFQIAKEHLKHGSVLLYFNHFAKLDSIMFGKVIEQNLAPLNQLTGIASRKHFDSKRSNLGKVQKYLADGWEEAYGLGVIQLVQNYDKENYQDSEEFNRNSLRQTIRLLRTPGNVVAIAPEGTRSKSDQLLKAEDGLELVFKLGGKNVLALPLAAVHGSVVPIATKTKVKAGVPFFFEDIQEEHKNNPERSIPDLMMRRLALLIPEQNRGYYK